MISYSHFVLRRYMATEGGNGDWLPGVFVPENFVDDTVSMVRGIGTTVTQLMGEYVAWSAYAREIVYFRDHTSFAPGVFHLQDYDNTLESLFQVVHCSHEQ